MNKIFYFIFFIFCICLNSNATTLQYFQSAIIKNNPAIHAMRLENKIQNNLVEIQRDIENKQVSVEPSVHFEKPISNQYMSPISLSTMGFDISKSQLIPKNGASLAFLYNFSVIDQDTKALTINDESQEFSKPLSYQNRLTFRYQLPLLKNFKGLLSYYPYKKQIQVKKLVELQILENIEMFVVQKSIEYLEWVYLYHQYLVALDQKKIMNEQLVTVKQRLKQGLVEKIDFLRAEDAFRNAERDLVLTQDKYVAQATFLSEISKDDIFLNEDPKFDFIDVQTANFLTQNEIVDLLRIKKQKEVHLLQFDEDITAKKEEIKSVLNLNVEAGLQGEDKQISTDFLPQKPVVSASIFYELKQDNKRVMKELENLMIEKQSVSADYESRLLEKLARIKKLTLELHSIKKVIKINIKNKKSAELTYMEETRRYNNGIGDLRYVIAAKENQNRVKNSLNENYFLFHKMYIQYQAECDSVVLK